MKFKAVLEGRFRCVVYKAGDAPRVDSGWFKNIITDYGLNLLGTIGAGNVMGNIHVGTGTGTPATTDTGLFTWLASHGSSQYTFGASSSAPYYGYNVYKATFTPGQATGNISELGVSNASGSGASLFSHALVLDETESPTTISVLADEYLDVYYELRGYPPESDISGSLSIGDADYDATIRPSYVTNGGVWGQNQGSSPRGAGTNAALLVLGSLGSETSSGPSGTTVATLDCNSPAYVNNSLQRGVSVVWPIGSAGSFNCLAFNAAVCRFQIQYTRTATANGSAATTTSTTSLATATGSKVFTTNVAGAYQIGDIVVADSDGSPDFMRGDVTAISGTTLTVNVTTVSGSGTHADWTITLYGDISKSAAQQLTLNSFVSWARGA